MTSNCAGQPAGCTVNSNTGFDVASFMLGLVNSKNRALFDAEPYTEKRPEYSLYMQDDFRATSRLTLNLGLRWDVYPPWIEVNDLQSNFDETTGKFVVASDDAVIAGRRGRPAPADLLEGRLRPALRLRLRPRRQRQDRRPRRLRHLLELHPRRHLVVEGAEPAVPAVDVAQRRRRPPTASTCCSRTACRRRPGVDPNRPAVGHDALDLRHQLPRRLRAAVEPERPALARRPNYMVEVAVVGSQGRQMLLKGDPNQAPPVVGVSATRTSTARTPRSSPALRTIGQVQAAGTLDYNALLIKFQRRFANNFSFLNAYTYGKAIDLELRQRRSGHADQRLRPAATTAGRPTTTSPTRSRRTGSTSCRGPRDKLYGGWQVSGILTLRGGLPLTVTTDAGRAVDRDRQPSEPASATAASRTRPSISGSTPAASWRRPTTPAPTANAGRGIIRGPGSFNIDASLIKNTEDRPVHDRVPRRGVQPAEPPAVRQPEHDPRQRRIRDHLVDAVEPVVLAVRHHRAAGAARA